MTWSTPLTAVTNTALTAAQWNASVRDNLLETAPAKATTAGGIFVSTGANAIAERLILTSVVDTSETTTSTAYTDLATGGPAVTLTTGTQAMVYVSARMSNSASGPASYASVAVSGATTVAAPDNCALLNEGTSVNSMRGTAVSLLTGLTAGSNTFTMKYRVASNTGTFVLRKLVVRAL